MYETKVLRGQCSWWSAENRKTPKLKKLLENENNKSMEIKIIEKDTDNGIQFKEETFNNSIKVKNQIINSVDGNNDSTSSEEDLDSILSSEEVDLEENSYEINQVKKIKFDNEKNKVNEQEESEEEQEEEEQEDEEEDREDDIHIYTDGACRGNPGDGGWAAVLAVQGSTAATTARSSYGCSWGQTSPYWGQL